MKNLKAFISDYDHTLVGRDKIIPAETVEAIKKLSASGVIVTIATGRPFYGHIQNAARVLDLQFPIIVCGGAELIDPKTEKVIWGEYMPAKELTEIVKTCVERNYEFAIEKGQYIFTALERDKTNGPLEIYGKGVIVKQIEEITYDNCAKLVIVMREAPDKYEKIVALKEELERKYPDLHVIRMGKEAGLDITSGKASKHVGVLEFLTHMKINPDDAAAIGDGYNDYPLLTAVGTKIAMGDAPEELKQLADFVAPPQTENGILTAINKYFSA